MSSEDREHEAFLPRLLEQIANLLWIRPSYGQPLSRVVNTYSQDGSRASGIHVYRQQFNFCKSSGVFYLWGTVLYIYIYIYIAQ